MLRIRIAICASLLSAGVAHAGIDNAGTTAGNFLSVGTGAGILSMGGATLGGGQDLNAAAWNPAALGRLAGSQFALSHAALAAQSSQDWLAAGGRVGRAGTRWGATALYEGDGSFDGRDAFGAPTGSFNVSSMALGVQVAQPVGERLTAGLAAHWVSENLGDVSGHGLGFDAGVQASAGAFGFGAAVRNVGGSMNYTAGRYDLPAVYGVGASWSNAPSGIRLAVDANFPSAYYNDVRVGGEWRWQDRLALRAGYRLELGAAAGEPLGGPSFGLGAGADGVWMDYAFLASGADAQGQHRLGLTFHPGFLNNRGVRPVADAPAPPPPPVARAMRPAPEAAAPLASAFAARPPADALAPGVSPRPLAPAARAAVTPSRPVRVRPLAIPARSASRPPVAATTPKPAANPPAAPSPVAATPDAPAATSAPAPIAQVASSTPKVTVVTRPATPAPAPAAATPRPAKVTVAPGERLADIAHRWHTSVAALMMENNLVREQVKPGQTLRLPPE